jgi:hypothetical protein
VESNIAGTLLDWLLFEARDRVLDAARGSPEMFQRPASDDLAATAAFDDAIRKLISEALAEIHIPNWLIQWTLSCQSRNNRHNHRGMMASSCRPDAIDGNPVEPCLCDNDSTLAMISVSDRARLL